jgi:uncharacterized cupin superfamily protein
MRPRSRGSHYPEPFNDRCRDIFRRRLAKAAGLKQIGVNLLELPPGAWSSQRHWHTQEEEFVYVIAGEVVLVGDTGEEILRAGDCAAFPPGEAGSHHLQNRSASAARVLEVGLANLHDDECHYPDIDLHATASGHFHKDGTPY